MYMYMYLRHILPLQPDLKVYSKHFSCNEIKWKCSIKYQNTFLSLIHSKLLKLNEMLQLENSGFSFNISLMLKIHVEVISVLVHVYQKILLGSRLNIA